MPRASHGLDEHVEKVFASPVEDTKTVSWMGVLIQ